jgi:hypothetical protein
MATDRDEQQRQQRELEEIRRSFAEMDARMGSLFEPTEPDESAPSSSSRPALPAPPPAPAPARQRPRWFLAGVLAMLFLAGTAFGWVLFRGDGGSSTPPATQAPPTTVKAQGATPPPVTVIRTKKSVPNECVDAAELADEVISRLNRNQRDNALAVALRDYTIASQACRREASP